MLEVDSAASHHPCCCVSSVAYAVHVVESANSRYTGSLGVLVARHATIQCYSRHHPLALARGRQE
eukprot:541915-Amphidinium_carterae.1